MNKKPKLRTGRHDIPGVTKIGSAYNITVSAPADRVSLVLRQNGSDLIIPMDDYRIGSSRSILLSGINLNNAVYGFQMAGFPEDSRCTDGLYPDIYAKRIIGRDSWDREEGELLCKITDRRFDWQDDAFPNIPLEECVVYEAHIRGFSMAAKGRYQGTYKGMQSRIPYLKKLGINAVELLPIFEFDQFDNPNINPYTGERLKNYWGYSTIGFFAPKAAYASDPDNADNELKSLVRALHRNNIEIWLDVVFNHTGKFGDMLSFAGAGSYYLTDEQHSNLSGCGNTTACGRSETARYIINCLEYWRTEFHIDGFRFDLCSVLSRDADGELVSKAPLIEAISTSPLLKECKLIAEPWDAGGGYQLGEFSKIPGWSEWNGHYRDSLRCFLTGWNNSIANMAKCIEGSPDIFSASPVNFITCHDGFTLYDLFSYNQKHNDANGENSKDGSDNNISINMGIEGQTENPDICERRRRFAANALTILLMSGGTPMLRMGDEVLHSQAGNNNAYCQDNAVSYLPWKTADKNMLQTVRRLIAFRRSHRAFSVRWHGTQLNRLDQSWTSHTLAWEINVVPTAANNYTKRIYVIANMYSEPLSFQLPEGIWETVYSTDKSKFDNSKALSQDTILCRPETVYILINK